MNILMVQISHDRLGETGKKTGFWLEDGPLWDLAEDAASIALIEAFARADKALAFVCDAPGVLRHVKLDGHPLVRDMRVTGFSDTEEAAAGLTEIVPLSVQRELSRLGGRY
jgi:putative intracellular protease/amidase